MSKSVPKNVCNKIKWFVLTFFGNFFGKKMENILFLWCDFNISR